MHVLLPLPPLLSLRALSELPLLLLLRRAKVLSDQSEPPRVKEVRARASSASSLRFIPERTRKPFVRKEWSFNLSLLLRRRRRVWQQDCVNNKSGGERTHEEEEGGV